MFQFTLSRSQRLSFLGAGVLSDSYQTQRLGSWIPGEERAKKVWQAPSRLMEGRNGYVNSVPNIMCGRGGVAGAATTTYWQAVAARTGEGSMGLSSSSEEEDKKYKSQEAEIKELRAQVERFRRQRGDIRKIREDVIQKEERMLLLSDRVANNEMGEPEMEAELQGLQAGEERRGNNATQAVDC